MIPCSSGVVKIFGKKYWGPARPCRLLTGRSRQWGGGGSANWWPGLLIGHLCQERARAEVSSGQQWTRAPPVPATDTTSHTTRHGAAHLSGRLAGTHLGDQRPAGTIITNTHQSRLIIIYYIYIERDNLTLEIKSRKKVPRTQHYWWSILWIDIDLDMT